jgi:hypothetical protein
MSQVSMDYGVVGNVAQGFDTAADTLSKAANIIEAALQVLRAAAFISFGATAMFERYLEGVKPRVEKLGATCQEMGQDLRDAIRDHQAADQDAAPTFQ